jgi:methionyl aminopeptidase
MMDYNIPQNIKIKNDKARNLFNYIKKTYSTLAFCRKWLDQEGQTNHSLALKNLVDQGIINPYPPLSDVPGCYVAQFEHTFLLRPTCKEILSRGDDY